MEFESYEQFVLTLSSAERDEFKEILELVEEIKQSSLVDKSSANCHLLLREKYFLLVQKVIEKPHDLIMKFVFNFIQNFLLLESKCEFCSYKEKCQFLLNVLRYIQHNIINTDMFKLELLRFLMNNNQTIETFLSSKILTCVLEISLNEANSENKIVESTCKAVAIKYTALVCNQISSYKHKKKDSVESISEDFDSYLVNVFAYLLNAFKQEHRSPIPRSLSLECMELLLNNLINESYSMDTSANFYDLKKNEMFIEFAWQTFCPSILFQFGELGLTEPSVTNHASTNNNKTVYFRQIYSILIQLTALIGGCNSMISVFEAVYQRILTYPPENDRAHILKLFKNYLTEKFVVSICFNEFSSHHSASKADFTLMNLIVGFFRNCYELAVKEPEDRILQLLSCECLSVFVQILYNLFMKTQSTSSSSSVEERRELCLTEFDSIFMCNQKELEKQIDTKTKEEIRCEATHFISHFSKWLSCDLSTNFNSKTDSLDLKIKQFSLEFIKETENWKELAKLLRSNPDRIYSATHFCFYVLFKRKLNATLCLSDNNLFECENQAHRNYFIHRVLLYDQLDSTVDAFESTRFILWLTFVYKELFSNTSLSKAIEVIEQNASLYQQVRLVVKQLDTFTKLDDELKVANREETTLDETSQTEQIRRLLKCLWTYFVDVFVGFLVHANLAQFEKCLTASNTHSHNTNASLTDFSFTLFALKSCLDSVFKLIQLMSSLGQMDKELAQIFFLLRANWLKDGSFNLDRHIPLNQFICLDFLLYACTQLVCDSNRVELSGHRQMSKSTRDLIWKCMTECSMIAAYLSANIETLSVEKASKMTNNFELPSGFFSTRSFLTKRENLFKSVYSNLNELTGNEWENALKLIRRKSSTWSLSSTVDTHNDGPSAVGHTDINSAEFHIQQREIIVKSSFLFYNSNNYESIQEMDTQSVHSGHKRLIEVLMSNVHEFFFTHLIDSTIESNTNASFDLLWLYCSHLCKLSERFLLNEPSIRHKHEYLSMNNLIIDKIDELLVRLVTKLALNEEHDSTHVIGVNISSSLIPHSSNRVHLPKPYSLYAVFLSELWLNVFNVYFNTVFTKFFAVVQTPIHITTTSPSPKNKRKKDEEELVDKNTEPLVDLAVCKKLVLLIQKAFEVYNRHALAHLNYLQLRTNQTWSEEMRQQLPSDDISLTSGASEESQSILDIESLGKKLDEVRESLKRKSEWTSSLLHEATVFLLKPESKPNAEQMEVCLIDESFNMNRLFLLPYKQLMSNERLDSHLKDAVIVSLCELVENSSGRCMKNSWNYLFDCLVDLKLDHKRGKRRHGKLKRIITRSEEKTTNDSSDSSLASSSSSDEDAHHTDDYCSRGTFKFDSYRIRLNSLTDIFHIYLNLSSTCKYTLANGSIGFIRCVTSYLTVSNAFDELKCSLKRKEESEPQMRDESEEDEDLFLSTNDSRIQERFHEFTSNYEHLSKLAKTSNSNTLNKPFLTCLQTLFDLFIKQHNNLNKFQTHSVEIEFKGEANPELDLNSLHNKYKLDKKCIRFESDEHFVRLGKLLDEQLIQNAAQNRFKLLFYFMNSLITKIYLTHDELNCVQMSELVFDFLGKLLECGKEEVLVGCCLLDMMQMIIKALECLESSVVAFNSEEKPFLSPKLAQNKFFMASLLNNQLSQCLKLIVNCSRKAEPNELVKIQLSVCCLNRLFYLIAKSLQMKLERFDALIDLTTIELDLILSECFLNQTNEEIVEACLKSIESINFLSFLPFRCLAENYSNKPDGKSFEILTEKCRNAWQLFNVKRSFNLAKSLFSKENEEEIRHRSKASFKSANSESSKCEFDLVKEELNQVDEIETEESDERQFESNERNFYRDFTLRFYPTDAKSNVQKRSSETSQVSTDPKFKTIFAQIDQEEHRIEEEQQVNLTSFLVIFKFQLNLIKALEKSMTNSQIKATLCENKSGSLRLLGLFNEIYLETIKLERVLTFKILLSKIFYLNQENTSACFVYLTKSACICILQGFFHVYLDESKNNGKFDWLNDFYSQEKVTDEGKRENKLLNHLENVVLKIPSNQDMYFSGFLVHFWIYYLKMNELAHNFTFERVYLSNFYEKFNSIEEKDWVNEGTEKFIEKELNELFALQKENNKALAMLNLSMKIESESNNQGGESQIDHLKRPILDLNSNESLYLLKDSRFCYQIWSNQISIRFLKDLSESLDLFIRVFAKENLESSKLFFKLLIQFVLVFNSCSNYCQCSTVSESKQHQHLLEISRHIVFSIFKQVFRQFIV